MNTKKMLTLAVLIDSPDGFVKLASEIDYDDGDKIKWVLYDRSDISTYVDADEDDETRELYEKYHNNDTLAEIGYIEIVEARGKSNAFCYNDSLAHAETELICFTNEYMTYDKSAFAHVFEAAEKFDKCNIFTLKSKLMNDDTYFARVRTDREVKAELLKVSDFRNNDIFANSVFFRTENVKGQVFTDICKEESDTVFLLKQHLRNDDYVFISGTFGYYEGFIKRNTMYHYGASNKDFYIPSLVYNFIPLLRSAGWEHAPSWLKACVYYKIYAKYYSNEDGRNQFLLDEEELKMFFLLTREILQIIPDSLIMGNEGKAPFDPPLRIRNFFMYLKYDGDLKKLERKFHIRKGNLIFTQRGVDYIFGKSQNVRVRAMSCKCGTVRIEFMFPHYMFKMMHPNAISVEVNGKKFETRETFEYSLNKLFNVSIYKGYLFQVKIPAELLTRNGATIEVALELGSRKLYLPMSFVRYMSKLFTNVKSSYWMIDENWALEQTDTGMRSIYLDEEARMKREEIFIKDSVEFIEGYVKHEELRDEYIRMITTLRPEYFRMKNEMKGRRIWMYYDKLYKAGDNGEYAFEYAMDNKKDDGIEHYYVLFEDSPDYTRMKAIYGDHILNYNSDKCKLYALYAENAVATHPSIMSYFGFEYPIANMFKDLFNPNHVWIAHGLTIQKEAEFSNRLNDDVQFFTTTSKYEYNHILQPIYGYSEDMLKMTGLARFDKLKSNDKKQILITPTWRNNLVEQAIARNNKVRPYSRSFKHTDYFRIYNSLINDPRLIETAKKKGYRIVFLTHPAMSTQLCDYDKNEYTELLSATDDVRYDKILTESSLMVTDYSGVAYDFGYMRKPIVYFQPKEIPMRYDEGCMKFKTMGFGPVIEDYDEAVNAICEFMENDCAMPDEYRKRADDWFAFDDFNNCQRIYDAVYEWTNNRRNKD